MNCSLSGKFNDSLYVDGQNYTGKYFIIKYKSSGVKDWIKVFNQPQVNNIFISKSGFLYVLITFANTVSFYNQNFIADGPSNIE